MKTKDKIKQTALELFNAHGVDQIALRDIASAMNISPGNLTYHFKRRDDLVYALYLDLVEEIDQWMSTPMSPEAVGLELLIEVMAHTYNAFERHRFIMVDFAHIMRNHERVRAHYQALQHTRRTQHRQTFDVLIAQGLMQQEAFPGQFEALIMQMTMVGDFFFASMALVYDLPQDEQYPTYVKLLTQLLWPYLTQTGQDIVRPHLMPNMS